MNVTLTPPSEREFPAARLQQRRQQLVSWIEAEQRGRARRPLHRRRWPVAAIVATGAAAAVAIATTTVLLTANGGGPSSAGIPSVLRYIQSPPRERRSEGGRNLAAVVLLDAARTAAHRPAAASPGPDQFVYTKVKAMWGIFEGRYVAFQVHTREDWVRPDGSGRDRDVEGHMLFPTATDAAYFYKAYRNQPSLLTGRTADETYEAGGPNYNELSKVPTDPAQLKQLIESRKLEGGPPGDAETFQIIGDLLRRTGAPPAVRSALYTIASQLPGVQLIGPTHDQLGRPGVGVAYDEVSGELRDELIFDPQTSGLLAEQTTVVHRAQDMPFPPGSVVSWTCYLASGVVDSSTATTSAVP
jgi:hypothetical protein